VFSKRLRCNGFARSGRYGRHLRPLERWWIRDEKLLETGARF
jgi:hypothetical protein